MNYRIKLEHKNPCKQCEFKCESDNVMKHHIAKNIMKPMMTPPPDSDIDPTETNSDCAYFNLKFIGNHAYRKYLIKDHKYFYLCGHCKTQLPHSNKNIHNILNACYCFISSISTFHHK